MCANVPRVDARFMGTARVKWSRFNLMSHRVVTPPMVLVPLGALLVYTLSALTGEFWRLWGFAGVLIPAGLAHWFLLYGKASWRLPVFFLCALLGSGLFIFITGGLQSPLLMGWVMVPFIIGFNLPYRRFGVFLLIPAALVIGLVLDAVIHQPTPWFELWGRPGAVRWHAISIGVVVVVLSGIGFRMGQHLRHEQEELRKLAMQAERAVADRLREKNQALQELAGSLAHELKNPLSAVLALSSALETRASDGTPQQKQLQVITSAARRMRAILHEFLNFARPLDRVSLTSVVVGNLVDELNAANHSLAETRSVSLKLEGNLEATVEADMRKLGQVYVNLLQNALDASPAGSQITTRIVGPENGWLRLLVEDTGVGVPEALRGRLFLPGVTGKHAGSGLGLSICQAIVEAHGGQLELRDRPEGGCLASVCLPLTQGAAS